MNCLTLDKCNLIGQPCVQCSRSHLHCHLSVNNATKKKNRLLFLSSNINEKDLMSTFDMWTPRLLWIPEHCMHIKMPRFTLAHRGPLPSQRPGLEVGYRDNLTKTQCQALRYHEVNTYLALQSAHSLFSGNLRSPSRICRQALHKYQFIGSIKRLLEQQDARKMKQEVCLKSSRFQGEYRDVEKPNQYKQMFGSGSAEFRSLTMQENMRS